MKFFLPKNYLLLSVALFAASVISTATADEKRLEIAPKENWVSMFDGKTLDGWHQVGDGDWIVEDGAIVGKTDKAAKLYGLLVSDKKFKNVKVRFKFKSIEGNSGFYVRGYIEKPDRANGLQVEVDPRNGTGGIYESYKRAWVCKPTKELTKKCYKLDQWNEMEIIAKDGYVATHLNGIKVAEMLNDPVQKAGSLILQMHAGNKILVYFKEIEVVELP